MKWKFDRINWYKDGLCWRWTRIDKHVYYSGNQVHWQWGRIGVVFERKQWLYPEGTRPYTTA